jgi:hypothetical protein
MPIGFRRGEKRNAIDQKIDGMTLRLDDCGSPKVPKGRPVEHGDVEVVGHGFEPGFRGRTPN